MVSSMTRTYFLFTIVVLIVMLCAINMRHNLIPNLSLKGASNKMAVKSVRERLNDTWWPSLADEKWDFRDFYNSIRDFIKEEHRFPYHLVQNASIFGPLTNFRLALNNSVEGDPLNHLASCRTPCWFGRPSSKKTYRSTRIPVVLARWNKTIRDPHHNFVDYSPRSVTPGPQGSRLYCQPAVYTPGQFKSGTTDLWSKLVLHPDIEGGRIKEPEISGDLVEYSERQLYNFTLTLQEELMNPAFGEDWIRNVLALDGRPSFGWKPLQGMRTQKRGLDLSKTSYIGQLSKLALNPRAKFIFILRNPADRAYSHYRHFYPRKEQSVKHFHSLMLSEMNRTKSQIKQIGLRNAYFLTFGDQNSHLMASMYFGFLRDWFDLVPRDQLMFIQSERYYSDTINVMQNIAEFLGIEPYPEHILPKIRILSSPKWNANSMLNITRDILGDFFRPFNIMLADMLEDEGFLWEA